MKVDHVPCGAFANESERNALDTLKRKLQSLGLSQCWVLLSNLAHSVSPRGVPEEVDIVAIGTTGIWVIEVKHWSRGYLRSNQLTVETEATKLNNKIRKLATKIRRIVPDTGFIAGRFLFTRESSAFGDLNRPVVCGASIYALSEWKQLLEIDGPAKISEEDINRIARELEPRVKATLEGSIRRMAHLANLELQATFDGRFHRVLTGQHSLSRDRVVVHLYDLSAYDGPQPEKVASREFSAVLRLQKSPWVPRVTDSFQEAPDYPGELFFFSFVDPAAPALTERVSDLSWTVEERLRFAQVSCTALDELHQCNVDEEVLFVHRNITPATIHVTADNQPLFTGFHLAKTSGTFTVSSSRMVPEEAARFQAPEVKENGLGVADHRSDIYSLCASLRQLFQDTTDPRCHEATDLVDQGLNERPDDRSSLNGIAEMFSEILGEPPILTLPSARYWSEGILIPFNDRYYRLVSRLGAGGFGITFKVVEEDPNTGEQYGTYVGKIVFSQDVGKRALQAYRRARAYTTEPHLSPIYEVANHWSDNTFIGLMKWIDGCPLHEWAGFLEPYAEELGERNAQSLALRWIREGCLALRPLHDAGLVHGDVSPRNIIESLGEITLTDYDLVLREDDTRWNNGTPMYCSPTAVSGQPARASDDVFALAASVFHVICEREPFRFGGEFRKDRGVNWDEIGGSDWGVVARFVDKATASDANDRFGNAIEAIRWLEESGKKVSEGEQENEESAQVVEDTGTFSGVQPAVVLTANEVPWFREILRSYPGSRYGNVETRGLDSDFALETYVETDLDRNLLSAIYDRKVRLVILCGNAGDGKTAFLQHLAKKLGLPRRSSSERVWDVRLRDGLQVRANLDGSAAFRGKSSDELLVGRLGLWPIRSDHGDCDVVDLDTSARMVEGLLLATGTETTAETRVSSLMLEDVRHEKELESFVRRAVNLPVEDALLQLEYRPDLQLKELTPVFGTEELRQLELSSWRTRTGKVAKWSGLNDMADALPEFTMHSIAETPAQYSKLEVRWNTHPDQISAGSVDYHVSVKAGNEELASRTVSHTDRPPQKARFTNEDFEDLAEDSKFEVRVQVVAIGVKGVSPVESEDFLLKFGKPPERANAGAGRLHRALVEGAITVDRQELFVEACDNPDACKEDRRGYVSFRPGTGPGSRSFRVFRPPLLRVLEAQWAKQEQAIGRWSVTIRADGKRVGDPVFHAIDRATCSEQVWDRAIRAAQRLCDEVARWPGSVARVYCGSTKAAEEYVNAWAAALEQAAPSLALAQTAEVQTQAGQTIGLVVLPTHPLRVAWHMGYDQLAEYSRYEENARPLEIQRTLTALESDQFPFLMPGLNRDSCFVFGDMMGFHSVAMVSDKDREPKAAIAQMAACLAEGQAAVAPSVGSQMASVLAKEVKRYLEFHPPEREACSLLHVNALRPGDGMTVARALGETLKSIEGTSDFDDDAGTRNRIAFALEMFSAASDSDVTGSYLTEMVEKKRSGAGTVSDADRWMFDSISRPGGIMIPRLRWARREDKVPTTPAHLSVVFDAFLSKVVCLPKTSLNSVKPLHIYGLKANVQRTFTYTPVPAWESYVPPRTEGDKHPATKSLTDRLLRLHHAIMRSVAQHLGYGEDYWPAVRTEMTPDNQDEMISLHNLSDWVITIDRNAGIEFFDSPRNARAIYDAYVIDCVPERDDLGSLQLVTSTTKLDEVRDLLDESLANMGLSGSLRNCGFLLGNLKAVSGRLAIRLTSPATSSGELIALALVKASCVAESSPKSAWLPGVYGFFVPLDDVQDLEPPRTGNHSDLEGGVRADLLFVGAPSRGGLYLSFVEVKYRRHLRLARDPQLIERTVQQAESNCLRWIEWYFGHDVADTACAIRRSRLARMLRFYADKAVRHHLDSATYERIVQEIDKIVTQGKDYRLTYLQPQNRGYIFCPELADPEPVVIPTTEGTETPVYLFGPARLPDLVAGASAMEQPSVMHKEGTPQSRADGTERELKGSVQDAPAPQMTTQDADRASDGDKMTSQKTLEVQDVSEPAREATRIVLGSETPDDRPVTWDISIASNPHLMLVGLPGMGKTTCLINVCQQLIHHRIVPIVFSYHQDIDGKMADRLDEVQFHDPSQLGFNPMQLDDPSPIAFVDNVGQLRDIFSAMFPDLGDIQLDRIRRAIKESYIDMGWNTQQGGGSVDGTEEHQQPSVPEFRTFFLKLQQDPKPDRGLLARLEELDDYGIFASSGSVRTLLDAEHPSVLRIHSTQNEVIQRAYAMLSLYSLYKEMFRRGVQNDITHAVLFDEAHRASRLKLLRTMAKECRKYGLSLIVASQEAKDFDASLFSVIANYLLLRMTEKDARVLAKNITTSNLERRTADRLKMLDKYHGLFFREGRQRPTHLRLSPSFQ